MKSLPKPVRCDCGKQAKLVGRFVVDGYGVGCSRRNRDGSRPCWIGPARKTKRGAINAWNKVMRK